MIRCIEHAHYYKFIFQNFFKFPSIKFYYLCAQKEFASYITIHLYKDNLRIIEYIIEGR